MRWSGDIPEMLVRMTWNLPLAPVNLYSHMAVSTIPAIGHRRALEPPCGEREQEEKNR